VLLSLACFLGTILFLLFNSNKNTKRFGNFFYAYFWYFLIITTIVAILTVVTYPEVDRLRVFARWAGYMTLVFVFMALIYCKTVENGLLNLLTLLEKVATVGFILYILNALLFQMTGRLVFPGQAFLGDSEHASVRYFLVRLSTPAVFDFSILASFVMGVCLDVSHRKSHFFSFILGLFVIIGIAQSRAEIAAVMVACFVVLVIKYGYKHPILSLWFAGIVLLVVLAFSGGLSRLGGLFTVNGSLDSSTLIRGESTTYYLTVFKSNPLFGFGFITGSKYYFELEHGLDGLSWVSDVGIFGQLAEWGTLFLIAYVTILIRSLYIIITRWQAVPLFAKCLMAACFVYIILTSFSLIILSTTTGLCFALYVLIFEYIASCYPIYNREGDKHVIRR
jgi:hypothetical protein